MVEEGALPPPRRWHTRKLWLVTEVEAALLDLPIEGEQDHFEETLDRAPALRSRQAQNAYDAYLKREAHLDSLSAEEKAEFEARETREWEEEILRSDLNARERTVLKQLAEAGIWAKLRANDVKGAGSDTIERLKLRGFADGDFRKKFPDRHENYWITEAGMAAWQSVAHLPTMKPRPKGVKKAEKRPDIEPRARGYQRPSL